MKYKLYQSSPDGFVRFYAVDENSVVRRGSESMGGWDEVHAKGEDLHKSPLFAEVDKSGVPASLLAILPGWESAEADFTFYRVHNRDEQFFYAANRHGALFFWTEQSKWVLTTMNVNALQRSNNPVFEIHESELPPSVDARGLTIERTEGTSEALALDSYDFWLYHKKGKGPECFAVEHKTRKVLFFVPDPINPRWAESVWNEKVLRSQRWASPINVSEVPTEAYELLPCFKDEPAKEEQYEESSDWELWEVARGSDRTYFAVSRISLKNFFYVANGPHWQQASRGRDDLASDKLANIIGIQQLPKGAFDLLPSSQYGKREDWFVAKETVTLNVVRPLQFPSVFQPDERQPGRYTCFVPYVGAVVERDYVTGVVRLKFNDPRKGLERVFELASHSEAFAKWEEKVREVFPFYFAPEV